MQFIKKWYRRTRIDVKRLISNLFPVMYLNMRCVDWQIDYSDWPRCYHLGEYTKTKCKDGTVHEFAVYYGARAHYTVTAWHFWCFGRGRGYTAMQAAKRAVADLQRKDMAFRKHAVQNPLDEMIPD
jgi:hypothetical protein